MISRTPHVLAAPNFALHEASTSPLLRRHLSRCAALCLLGLITFAGIDQSSAAEKPTPTDQLEIDVDFLNEIVARYENANGWFSERDDAQLVLARLSYAGGDYDLPMMRQSGGAVKLVPVMAEEPPTKDKWAYWNHAKRRFVVWRGTAPIGVQPITHFKRTFRGRPRGLGEAVAQAPSSPSKTMPPLKMSVPVEIKGPRTRHNVSPPNGSPAPGAMAPRRPKPGWTHPCSPPPREHGR